MSCCRNSGVLSWANFCLVAWDLWGGIGNCLLGCPGAVRGCHRISITLASEGDLELPGEVAVGLQLDRNPAALSVHRDGISSKPSTALVFRRQAACGALTPTLWCGWRSAGASVSADAPPPPPPPNRAWPRHTHVHTHTHMHPRLPASLPFPSTLVFHLLTAHVSLARCCDLCSK